LINCQKRTDGFWQLIESLIKVLINWQLFRRLIKKFDQVKRSSEIRSSDHSPQITTTTFFKLKKFPISFAELTFKILTNIQIKMGSISVLHLPKKVKRLFYKFIIKVVRRMMTHESVQSNTFRFFSFLFL